MTWRKILSKIGVKFYVSLLLTMCRIMGLGDGRISKVPTSKVHKHPQCPDRVLALLYREALEKFQNVSSSFQINLEIGFPLQASK